MKHQLVTLSGNAIKPIPTPIKDVTSNIKELRDRVTALEAKTKEPPKTTQHFTPTHLCNKYVQHLDVEAEKWVGGLVD